LTASLNIALTYASRDIQQNTASRRRIVRQLMQDRDGLGINPS
jgi:hypothetical protein